MRLGTGPRPDDLERYLDSLIGSWQALAIPSPGAQVIIEADFVAARFPAIPALDNALLWTADVLPQVETIYADAASYAIWTLDRDGQLSAAIEAAGYRRDETTTPMIVDLDDVDLALDDRILHGADPAAVAALNGLPPVVLTGVPGLQASITRDGAAGLVLIAVGSDVSVSMVATREDARRRGLATVATRAALAQARADGIRSASLQATRMARSLCTKIGFRPVGEWQEWVRRPAPRS